jgi:hypothetical protein
VTGRQIAHQDLAETMPIRQWPFLVAIAAWHVACLAVRLACGAAVVRVVAATYSEWFGHVQASFGRFDRIATYALLIAATAPACALSLLAYDALRRRRVRFASTAAAFALWQLTVVAVFVCSYEVGFACWVHELDWAVFGHREIYSYRNLVLPHVVAWLVWTTPVAWAVLRLYARAPSRQAE